jgi:AraC-like DNA-binding protein
MNIVFARSWLLRPVHGANPSLYGKLMQQAAKLEAERAAALPDVVRRVLRRLMMAGRGSIEDVAAIFSVHRRTLDRQLDAHGVTFRQIADEVRFDVARQLLRDTAMSISEIAAALHYASPSAFATAFRRWSGTTASQWRRSAEPKSDAERKRTS